MESKKKKKNLNKSRDANYTSWDQFLYGWDIEGDDGFPIVAVLLLVIGILGGAIHFLWQAPILLDTIFVQSLLVTGSLKKIKQADDLSTFWDLISKTWVPFFIVFILVIIFSVAADSYCPGAETFEMLVTCKE